jgi:arabinofuranan 3-O-arabinosyltransferase
MISSRTSELATRASPAHQSRKKARFESLGRRLPEVTTTAALFVIVFLQRPGRITRDTKLNLSVDPSRFLSEVTHLWDPLSGFGSVPNQAYGYLFPIGPFYSAGSALHVPMWITERLWLGLLLAAAFWGTVLLAEALTLGGRWSRMAGATAYALSPIVLAQAHDTAYIFPAVFLPWVILPLVRVDEGRLPAWSGAARSGLAVLLMGGVNATEVFAVLVLPLLWFATRRSPLKQAKLVCCWAVAVLLATAWFMLPLWFQAKYWFNAVPYTETSTTTTAVANAPEILRGAGVWTSFSLAPTWTTAGQMLEANAFVIVATAVVAGIGLYGLARRDMPHRIFLASAVIVCAVIVCSGYWGRLGGPFSSTIDSLLGGSLTTFRNISKFQPVLSLAVALGFVHGVASIGNRWRTWNWVGGRPILLGLLVLVAAALGVSAGPALTGQIYPEGSFTAIPNYWHQAADWINARGSMSNTLVIPGSGFADLAWGNPLDQPIQALATVPWANRAEEPVGSVGSTQLLDSIDQLLLEGQPQPGLSEYLARAGVRYLLVENDVAPADVQGPGPAQIRLVLANEPGLDRVAGFGPVVRPANFGPDIESLYDPHGATREIRSLDVYRVRQTPSGDALVTTYPVSSGVMLSGGPQAELALANDGLLTNEAVGLSGDPLAPTFKETTWVDTDGQQRRDVEYTLLYDNVSYVLSPGETAAGKTGPPNQWTVVPGSEHETVSRLSGAASASASSYGPLFSVVPGYQPLSAFLPASSGSMWQANPQDGRPWLQINFDHPVPLHTITITPAAGSPAQTVITKVRVSTNHGAVTSNLAPRSRPQSVSTPVGDASYLRITLVGLTGARGQFPTGPGIVHVGIPGVRVSESWKVPNDGRSSPGITPSYVFTSPLPNQFAYFKTPDEQPAMSRTFSVSRAGKFVLSGKASPLETLSLSAHQLPSGGAPASAASLSSPYTVPCGFGPTLKVDGASYRTAVSGTLGDLYALRAMTLTVCGPLGPFIALSPGTHSINGVAGGDFKITQLALTGTSLSRVSHSTRQTTVNQWGGQSRTLTASAGPAAILNVHQNFNTGWQASVDGRILRPVQLDGWQQGWVLPASSRPLVIEMRFAPDGGFRAVLILGAGLAGLLVILALWPSRRRRRAPSLGETGTCEAVLKAEVASPKRTRALTATSLAVLTIAVFLIAGPVALAVPALIAVRRLAPDRTVLPWICAGGATLAGLAIALKTGYLAGPWLGNGSYTAQALGALALAALAASLVPAARRPRES